jgi:hypothetical protein
MVMACYERAGRLEQVTLRHVFCVQMPAWKANPIRNAPFSSCFQRDLSAILPVHVIRLVQAAEYQAARPGRIATVESDCVHAYYS